MADAAAFATYNRQGGLRGDTDVGSQNWVMGMAHRRAGAGTLTLTGMMSLEPITVGGRGYAEIFQTGEAYQGLAVTDRQHPHDLFGRLSAGWRVPIGRTALSLVAAPVGEAALGPVAFMHRASAADNPAAPLSHHVFDSTHIAHAVLLARVDRGPVSVEASAFRGREPDEHRFDLDLGAPDSWSARLWIRPAEGFTLQLSHGRLNEPEQLEPGDQQRTSASASWTRRNDRGFLAVTAAVGRVRRTFTRSHSLLIEGTRQVNGSSLFARIERHEVESEVLLFPQSVHVPHPGEVIEPLGAYTGGAVRRLSDLGAWTLGVGGDVTLYRVPRLLAITHGRHPASVHLFLRLSRREPSRRMLDQTMAGF